MNRQLPSNASLEHLKNQARALQRQHQEKSPEAAQRLRAHLPGCQSLSDEQIFLRTIGLQQAQTVLSREYGFTSWAKLKLRVEPPGPPVPAWKQLRQAIDADDVAKVQKILKLNGEALIAQPLHEGEEGYFNQKHCAFPYAVQGGRVGVVRWLAEKWPHLVQLPDHCNRTPVNTLVHTMATACAGLTPPRLEIYRLLKSLGAKPDLANAVKAPDTDLVAEFLRGGASPWEPCAPGGGFGNSPALLLASDAGHAQIVKLLLDTMPEPPPPGLAFSSFDRAILVNHRDVMDLLEPLIPRERLSDCLNGCCEFLNLDGVRYLLSRGANPHHQTRPGNPESYPLRIALGTYSRKPWRSKVIEALIEAGADLSQWEPAPQMAIHRGRPDLLAQLLEADPGLVHRQFNDATYGGGRDLKGGTLLHLAAEFYEADCVEMLLSRGADINARAFVDSEGIGGHTAVFHVAVSYKHFGISLLRRFVEAGADLTVEASLPCTRMGCVPREAPRRVTPLGWARWHDQGWPLGSMAEEIGILRDAGAPE